MASPSYSDLGKQAKGKIKKTPAFFKNKILSLFNIKVYE